MSEGLVKGSGLGHREWREDFQLVDDDGTVQFKVAKTTGAVTINGAIGGASNITVTNTAPSIVLADSTTSAKDLTIAVDSNLAQFRESAGAAGSLLVLDLANNRLGVATAAPTVALDVTGGAKISNGIDLSSSSPTSHPINMESITLASNMNAIRGASVNPTRTSGWISFSGEVTTTPAQVYTDYRNLTTKGTAEVLGIGSFPMMASGASCSGMCGVQSICQLDSGSTWLTGGGAAGVGIFPIFAKLTQTSATINSGAQGAAIYADVNANVSSISGETIANFFVEASSGLVRDMFYCHSASGTGWTNFFNFPAAITPFVATGCNVTVATVPYLKVLVGATVYGIPLIAI